jgi:hypothetical protein
VAADSLKKASTPEPFSKSKTSNWVARAGGLPSYIQHIAHDLVEKRGMDESKAIQMAIGIVKNWASGKGNIDATTRAAAQKAVAEWEKLKAKSAGKKIAESTVEDLDAWEPADEDRALMETVAPPTAAKPKPRAARKRTPHRAPSVGDPLAMRVEVGDLALLETLAHPGVTRYGHPVTPSSLPGNQVPKRKPNRTRTGVSSQYDAGKHPRGRGGEWTVKQGATGDVVRVVQRRVGAKADGQYGSQTAQRVMDFQRRHGLKVDGVVGRQTIAAMRGDANALHVSPGSATVADRRWLHARAAMRKVRETPADGGPLALKLDENLRIVESIDLKIHEEADLALVESAADGHAELLDLALLEAATADAPVQFNADGTIDMVIIRPCNGRGVGSRIYEADMLKRNAHVFSGWPSYDNHDSPAARRARQGLPRPPSELAGEVRESWWDPTFATPVDDEMGFGQGAVIGRFMLTEDMEKLIRRLPRAVKTSVNADATSLRPGTRNGRKGLIVEGIVNDPENYSVDLVTKAGAGGAVASLYRELAAA